MTESQTIEYKESWRDEYIKWISGFANAQGGKLFIGRDDRGKVVGIRNAQKLMEDIPNKVRDILGIMVDVNLHEDNEKQYVEIVVDQYPYPVSYKGQYFIRSGSTKQELKGAALDTFLLRRQGRHWDGVPVPYVKIRDLQQPVLKFFRTCAHGSKRLSEDVLNEPDSALIEKLHLIDGNHLKRAAVLLFHADPEKFVTGAFIKIGFFRTDADLLFHDEIHGDLFTQVKQTMDLLTTKYLKASISYSGIQRVEKLPVPEDALREALLNAVTHKDYSISVPIQISVYEDKIMFWNPGQLPADWTVENLRRKHSSLPFNPDIANTFFRAGMVESWGRGIERILISCRTAGIKEPDFRYDSTGLWVEFRYQNIEDSPASRGTTQETTPETTQEKILANIRKNPSITRKKLAEIIGITTDGVKYHLEKMSGNGIIKHVGPTKGGYWEILK